MDMPNQKKKQQKGVHIHTQKRMPLLDVNGQIIDTH